MSRRSSAAVLTGLLVLTSCGGQSNSHGSLYRMRTTGSTVQLTNFDSGNNQRVLLWNSAQHDATDSTMCARWVSGEGIAQNGIAFRVHSDSAGWEGVMIERNIFDEEFWNFVVIYIHSGPGHSEPFSTGPQVSLADYLGTGPTAVYPLRVCAQISGTSLAFSVAKNTDTMLPLGAPGRGASFQLDPTLTPASGKEATYAGHLPRDTTSVIDGITIDSANTRRPDTQVTIEP